MVCYAAPQVGACCSLTAVCACCRWNTNPPNTLSCRTRPGRLSRPHHIQHGQALSLPRMTASVSETLTNNLTWSKNVSVTAEKGNRVLGFLRRNLNGCSFKVRVGTYATGVRPILQYAACVWDPYLQKDIQQPDQV